MPDHSQQVAVPANPFKDDATHRSTSYHVFGANGLERPDGQTVTPVTRLVHDSFRAMVLHQDFSCVGGKAAINSGNYRFGLYSELGSADCTAALAHDLFQFIQDQPAMTGEFTTFVASFLEPGGIDEVQFEQRLWQQLQLLHELDRQHFAWDESVSDQPENPDFSFSFGGRAFFIVGLHAASSRWSRRFTWPTLIFNYHALFERLRSSGKYDRIQHVIRNREITLQGSLNANLGAFGERSEARQYSGRPAEEHWQCPFHAGPMPEASSLFEHGH